VNTELMLLKLQSQAGINWMMIALFLFVLTVIEGVILIRLNIKVFPKLEKLEELETLKNRFNNRVNCIDELRQELKTNTETFARVTNSLYRRNSELIQDNERLKIDNKRLKGPANAIPVCINADEHWFYYDGKKLLKVEEHHMNYPKGTILMIFFKDKNPTKSVLLGYFETQPFKFMEIGEEV